MGSIIKTLFALGAVAVAMAFTGCSDDDDDDDDEVLNGDKVYVFAAECSFEDAGGEVAAETNEAQREFVYNALAEEGFKGESEFPLCISGKDSEVVSAVLLEKMALVESAIAGAPFEINCVIVVKGAEKCVVESENFDRNSVKRWYEKVFGTVSNYDEQNAFGDGTKP